MCTVHVMVYSFITLGHILVRAQHTVTTLSRNIMSSSSQAIMFTGTAALSMVYFLRTHPTTLFKWTLRWAILRVSSASFVTSFCFFTSAHISPTFSLMSNPRSANTMSPGNSLWRRPLLSITYLSLTPSPHPLETKAIAPRGVMPMRYFSVCFCEDVCAIALWIDALSALISKQSTITATWLPKASTNCCNMLPFKQCLSGQCTKGLRCVNIALMVSLNVVDTVFWSMLKRCAMCWIGRFSLRRIRVKKSIWNGESLHPVRGRQGRSCVSTPIRTAKHGSPV